jgi:hypothetical protein
MIAKCAKKELKKDDLWDLTDDDDSNVLLERFEKHWFSKVNK